MARKATSPSSLRPSLGVTGEEILEGEVKERKYFSLEAKL